MKHLAVLVLLVFLLAACSLPAGVNPTLTPLPLPTTPAPGRQPSTTTAPHSSIPSPTPEIQKVVSVALHVRGSAQVMPDVTAGSTVVVEATFDPVVQALTRRTDGSVLSSSTTTWQNSPLAQMRFCISVEPQPCELGEWRPYQALNSQEIYVDWLGPRQFHLQAEFSDAAGQAIPSVRAYYYDAQPQTSLTLTMRSRIEPGTPLVQLPPPIQTAAAATQTAFPVTGSVQIEDGRCCAGGTAGSTIQLKVAFQAASSAGEVTEMKIQVGQCVPDPDQHLGIWEPYQAQRTFETTLAINWVGWWIGVQYRDSKGNLSPVYCDDISLEGNPPRPTQ